jgi:hypothetical protein
MLLHGYFGLYILFPLYVYLTPLNETEGRYILYSLLHRVPPSIMACVDRLMDGEERF